MCWISVSSVLCVSTLHFKLPSRGLAFSDNIVRVYHKTVYEYACAICWLVLQIAELPLPDYMDKPISELVGIGTFRSVANVRVWSSYLRALPGILISDRSIREHTHLLYSLNTRSIHIHLSAIRYSTCALYEYTSTIWAVYEYTRTVQYLIWIYDNKQKKPHTRTQQI